MRCTTLAAAASAALLAAGAAEAQKTFYKLGSLPPGTTPYIVHTAFANAVNKHVPDTEIQISATGPATQHMLLVTEGRMDFAMGAATAWRLMYKQIGPFKKIKDGKTRVRRMQMLFSYPIGAYQMVTYADSGIRKLDDVKGRSVFLGPPGGVATRNMALIVEAMTGYRPKKDYKQVRMGWGPAAQAFQDRKFDVWIPVSNAPSPQIQQIALNNRIRLLGLDESRFDRPAWKKYWAQPARRMITIAPDAYGENQVNAEPVLTTGAYVGLVARADIPAETIYRMMEAFWGHIDEAYAMAKWMPNTLTMDLAVSAIAGNLHPGAEKFFREKGKKIVVAYDPDAGIGK